MDLSQFGINTNNTPNPSSPFAIPGLEALQSTLSSIMIGSAVLGGLFIILYIISMVQRMRADRATIEMRKDIAAIKRLLEIQATPGAHQTNGAPAQAPPPAQTTPQ